MKKTNRSTQQLLGIILIISVWFSIPIYAAAQETGDEEPPSLLPGNIVRKISNMMRDQLPPYFASVTVKTQSSDAGRRVTIKLKTEPGYSENGKKAPIIAVGAQMSTNKEKTWKAVELNNEAARAGQITQWSASADIGGGAPTVALRAKDEKLRMAVTVPCKVSAWPAAAAMWRTSCVQLQDKKLDSCLAKQTPAGCMIQIAQDEPPVDDMPYTAGDDLDMIASYIGYDDKYIYLSMTVQREISPGSLTPIMLHQYAFVLMLPNKIAPATEDRIPHNGIIVRYMPQGETAPGFIDPCGIITLGADNKYILDTKSATCSAEGPFLFMKIDRLALGTDKVNELLVIAHTGTVRGVKKDEFSYVDFSMPTRVMFK